MRINNTWRDIDSATIIDRIAELGAISLVDADENDVTELAELQNLDQQGREHVGWAEGYVMLIKDGYMEDHAQERAEQEGKISFNEWPATAIDWHQAAEELKFSYGYIPVDFFDSTYWVVK